MGQYRQWLEFREVDQELRARLEVLSAELEALLDESIKLQRTTSFSDNPIIQALLAFVTPPDLLPETDPLAPLEPAAVSSSSVSPALFARANLPNFDTGSLPSLPAVSGALPATPHPELDLLPKDLSAFLDSHSSPPASPEFPGWLRTMLEPDSDERTNRSVERWLARWGKRPVAPELQQEDRV